jgi:hypothetical protein
LGLSSFVLYVATLAPDVVGGDAGEFQFVPYVLGIPHHTGYPLYTLIGRLWSILPLGSIAVRMNLLSAVFAGLTVSVVYLAAWEMSRTKLAALLAAVALAVSQLFWLWGTIAGVRSSTALMTAVVIYLALRWRRLMKEDASTAQTTRALVFLALGFGAALAHHRSIILMALPLALFVLTVNARIVLSARVMARSALFFALPLLSYLYLPIRSIMGASFDQFHPDTLPRFLDLVLATGLSQSFFSVPLGDMPARWEMFSVELAREFSAIGLALGLMGAAWLLLRNPAAFVLTSLFAVSVIAQTLNWNVGPERLNSVYLIPTYVVFVLWIGAGAGLLGDIVTRALGRLPMRAFAQAAVTAAVTLMLVWPFLQLGVENWEVMNARGARPLDKFRQNIDGGYLARRMVMGSLPYVEDNAVIYADWEQATAFWYAQQIEGIKTGVGVVYGDMDSVDDMVKKADAKPVYIARAVADSGSRRYASVGPLIKVGGEPITAAPSVLKPLNVVLGSQIALMGYVQYDERGQVVEELDGRSPVLPIALYWKALIRPEADYSVSARLVSAEGKMVAQLDNKHPVLSMYPTTRWEPGEVVGDYYELPLSGLAPGTYQLEIVMYGTSGQGWQNLQAVDASGQPLGERVVVRQVVMGR